MIRWGPWKYIAFGQTLKRFANYTPQLFNVEADPEELKDLAGTAQGKPIAAMLDAKLKGVVDYQAVDKLVKKNDAEIYKKWFLNKPGVDLRKKWEQSYTGFDDDDWKQAKEWWAELKTAVL